MAQKHLDRLSGLDVSFLTNETSSSHMHVGAILIFEGPPPGYRDLVAHIDSRLHLVPRFRQKLAFPPLPTSRPYWIDDPTFNLDYHVRHSALPSPGTEEQLRRTAARIFSQQLDRTKPLWELWLVQGLTRGRFALISKTHHALVDGVSGVDIATVLFDVTPVPQRLAPEEKWLPQPEPSSAGLIARDAAGAVKAPTGIARRVERAARHPRVTVKQVATGVQALSEVGWNFANPSPDVPLNQPIGSHRRFEWVRTDLTHFKTVKNALGGTVNDAVLTVVAGGLRKWLQGRGIRTEGLELTAQVPVSIRPDEQHGALGNQLAAIRGPLPVYVEDPVQRLEVVRAGMDGIKDSKQALGAEVIARFNDFAPPTLLTQAARLNFSTRLFNLVVTNVPGPQLPLYMLGRELQDVFPVGFLPVNHALFVAIMSYNGQVNFGLLADYDSMPDLDVIASGIEASLGELCEAAEEELASRESAVQEPAEETTAG